MPIYEYQCCGCGHTLETIQKASDAPLCTCPACNKDTLEKCISATSFRLKGDGWYVTDFKDKGTQNSTSTNTDNNTNKNNKTDDNNKTTSTTESSTTDSTTTSSTTDES